MVKNFFRKKINLRILSIFFLLLVSGNALLYINNSFHYYSVSYKVTVPTFKEIRNNQIIYLPLIDYYQFSKTLQNSNEINKNCSDFEKNFKINIWEAGDIENYSIKIRSKVEKKIDICFNEVLNEIEKFKQAEIKNARETMSFSTKTYFNSLKKVVTDDDYLAFIEFLKNSDITFNNFNDLTVLNSPNHSNLDDEFIETLLTIMQMEEKKKIGRNTNNSFIGSYLYYFIEGDRVIEKLENLPEVRFLILDKTYEKNKNLLKYTFGILMIFFVILFSVNKKNLKL